MRLRKRFYPKEDVKVLVDVEDHAAGLHINSITFDTWDGRFWENLEQEERNEWMRKAHKDLESNYVRVV